MAGKFEIKKSKNDKFHFNLKAGNGQIILSSEMYESKPACENGIESVKKNAGNADSYEHHTDKSNHPYFVLKAANGKEIGRSESYSSESALNTGIESVRKNALDATIDESLK